MYLFVHLLDPGQKTHLRLYWRGSRRGALAGCACGRGAEKFWQFTFDLPLIFTQMMSQDHNLCVVASPAPSVDLPSAKSGDKQQNARPLLVVPQHARLKLSLPDFATEGMAQTLYA